MVVAALAGAGLLYILPRFMGMLQGNMFMQGILGGTVVASLATLKSIVWDFVLSMLFTKVVLTSEKAPQTFAAIVAMVAARPGAVTPTVNMVEAMTSTDDGARAKAPASWMSPAERLAQGPRAVKVVSGERVPQRQGTTLPCMLYKRGRVLFISDATPSSTSLSVYMLGRAEDALLAGILQDLAGTVVYRTAEEEVINNAGKVFGVAMEASGTSCTASWKLLKEREANRALESLILPPGVMQDILRQCESYLRGQERYIQQGRPWRMGMLLHGPPGTGKSSMASVLCTALGLPLYILTLSDRSMNDSQLERLMNSTLQPSLILIEDVDCAGQAMGPRDVFRRRQGAGGGASGAGTGAGAGAAGGPDGDMDFAFGCGGMGGGGGGGITISGMLNALDGMSAPQGRIVMLTTNHKNNLDKALVRPGRCDIVQHLGGAVRVQVAEMFRRRFKGAATEAQVNAFADKIPEHIVPAAGIMSHLVLSKFVEEALDDDAIRKVVADGCVLTGLTPPFYAPVQKPKTLYWELWVRGLEDLFGMYLEAGSFNLDRGVSVLSSRWFTWYHEDEPLTDRNKLRGLFVAAFPAHTQEECAAFVQTIEDFHAGQPPDFPRVRAGRVRRVLYNSETPAEAVKWTRDYVVQYSWSPTAHRYDGGPPVEVILRMLSPAFVKHAAILRERAITNWQTLLAFSTNQFEWPAWAKEAFGEDRVARQVQNMSEGHHPAATPRVVMEHLLTAFSNVLDVRRAWDAARRVCEPTGIRNTWLTAANIRLAISKTNTPEECVRMLRAWNAEAVAQIDACKTEWKRTNGVEEVPDGEVAVDLDLDVHDGEDVQAIAPPEPLAPQPPRFTAATGGSPGALGKGRPGCGRARGRGGRRHRGTPASGLVEG